MVYYKQITKGSEKPGLTQLTTLACITSTNVTDSFTFPFPWWKKVMLPTTYTTTRWPKIHKYKSKHTCAHTYPPTHMKVRNIRLETASQTALTDLRIRIRNKKQGRDSWFSLKLPLLPISYWNHREVMVHTGRAEPGGCATCEWLSLLLGGGQLLTPDYTKMLQSLSHLSFKHIWTG